LRKNKDAGNATDTAAERHIADCHALLDKQDPQTAAAAQPAQGAKPSATSQPVAPVAEQVAPVAQPAPETRLVAINANGIYTSNGPVP
jgi:hypothetical protein